MSLYFIWKGMDCRAMGVQLGAPIPIIRPEERVQHVQIPGQVGDLTQLEGQGDSDPIFNSYIQTATIEVKGGHRVREVYNWLKGSGFVTFHGEPDRKQEARVIGAITLSRHSKNSAWWVGECQFYCQPLKQMMTESAVKITSSGSNVMNAGDVRSKPVISAKASGSTMVIAAGGKELTITGLTSSAVYIIDCEAQKVTNADGTENLTANSSGGFPVLNPGSNAVTGSGWSEMTIDRRERFL